MRRAAALAGAAVLLLFALSGPPLTKAAAGDLTYSISPSHGSAKALIHVKISEEYPQYSSYVFYMAFDNFGVGSIEIDRTDNFIGKATIGVPYGDGKPGGHKVCFSPNTTPLKCLIYTIDAPPKPKPTPKPTLKPTAKPSSAPLASPAPSLFPVATDTAPSTASSSPLAASPSAAIALGGGPVGSARPSTSTDLEPALAAAPGAASLVVAFAIGAVLALAMLAGLFVVRWRRGRVDR